jgi:hypothetical protein
LVEIEYTPWVKIVIHEVTEYPHDQFFEDIMRLFLTKNDQVEPVINWIDGIAYLIYSMPETEDVISDKMRGIIHFSSVSFTKIDYNAHYPIDITGHQYTVAMRKAENNEILSELVRWRARVLTSELIYSTYALAYSWLLVSRIRVPTVMLHIVK